MAGGTRMGDAPLGALAAVMLPLAATIAVQIAANSADFDPLVAFDAQRPLVGGG